MKKLITLLLAAGAFTAVDAQTTKEEARRVILGEGSNKGTKDNGTVRGRDVILGDNNGGDDTRKYPTGTNRQSAINQINREYDAKVNSIRNNPNLSNAEKERIIRDLENERKKKLARINSQYNGNDKKYKKDKKFKNNNGKHKGWTKGKGNKHRDRDDD